MKKTLSMLFSMVALIGWGQTEPYAPVQTPQPPNVPSENQQNNQFPADQPYFSGTFSNGVGIPGTFSNAMAYDFVSSNSMAYANLRGGTGTLEDVQILLQNLQMNIEQALPVLASLTGAANATASVAPGFTPNQSAGRRAFPPSSQYLPRTGNPNQRLYGVGQANRMGAQGLFGRVGTNTFAMDQQTFQLLIILHNELQQTLPTLQTLNNAANLANAANANQLAPTGFTNRFNRVLQYPGGVYPFRR
ncbi:MAG: hypothetical protein ACTHLW_19345 [Verrucomicrobiota bacterium]